MLAITLNMTSPSSTLKTRTQDNILDKNQIPGNYEENNSGANYCNGETACDIDIVGMEGVEDTFDDDDDKALENSNMEDEFSDMEELNENEGEEVPKFKF